MLEVPVDFVVYLLINLFAMCVSPQLVEGFSDGNTLVRF